jgi:hypothetical protein
LISRALALPNLQAYTSQRGGLLYSASALALFSRDFSAAGVLVDELGNIYQELGDAYKIWEHKFIRSGLLIGLGDYQTAIELLLEGRYVALEENLPVQVVEYFRQAFKLALDLSVQARVGAIYHGLGGGALQRGDLFDAANWMSLAVTIEKTTSYASRFMLDSLQERYLKALKERLDPTVFAANW